MVSKEPFFLTIREKIAYYAVAYAALVYATSYWLYMRNKEVFCNEPLFHQDILDNPVQAAQNLALKLGVQEAQEDFLENTLLPRFSEVTCPMSLFK